MDTKRLAAEIVADLSIGPKFGLNPMNQQIEALLEQETTLLGKKEGELSQLQKMIMKSGNETEISELQELLLDIQGKIELSKIKIEKLEGLWKESLYIRKVISILEKIYPNCSSVGN